MAASACRLWWQKLKFVRMGSALYLMECRRMWFWRDFRRADESMAHAQRSPVHALDNIEGNPANKFTVYIFLHKTCYFFVGTLHKTCWRWRNESAHVCARHAASCKATIWAQNRPSFLLRSLQRDLICLLNGWWKKSLPKRISARNWNYSVHIGFLLWTLPPFLLTLS